MWAPLQFNVCSCEWVFVGVHCVNAPFCVPCNRSPLLSLIPAHRDPKHSWVGGELARVHRARSVQCQVRQMDWTGASIPPQVNTFHAIFFQLKNKMIFSASECWFSACFTDLLTLFADEGETQKESTSEEKQPKPKVAINSTPSTQKVSVFPGLSPAALLVSSPSA